MSSIQLKLFLPKNYTEADTPPLTQLVDIHWSKLVAAIEAAQSTPGKVVRLTLPYGVAFQFIYSDTPDSSEQSWAAQLFEQIMMGLPQTADKYSVPLKSTSELKVPLS